jgi:hypothetical protein
MQGAVGLEKSRAVAGRERRRRAGRVAAAVGRMRASWICLGRSRIWTARVTVFNETTGMPLTVLCSNWNFMGIIVNIGEKFWAACARFACWRWRVGQCHRRHWLVNSHHLCWELGPAGGQRYLFILAVDADTWASHYFLSNETCFPKILEPIKWYLKNHKNMNNSYLDI